MNNGKKGYLSYREVLERLEEKGIKMTRAALKYWRDKGLIPKEYYIVEFHGTRRFFYYKPEVIDLIEEKVKEKVEQSN